MNPTILEGYQATQWHDEYPFERPATIHVYAANEADRVVYGLPSALRPPTTAEEHKQAWAVLYRIRVIPKLPKPEIFQ